MGRRSKQNVYQPDNSPFWHYEFVVEGRRIRGSTGCKTRPEAVAVAKAKKEQAQRDAKSHAILSADVVSLQMQDVGLRYWLEKQDALAGGRNVHKDVIRLVEFFGKTKLLSEIDDNDVAKLVSWRKAQRVEVKASKSKKPVVRPFVSPGTVNHTLVRLQAIFAHARREWKVAFRHEPDWRKHKLNVPRKTARVLAGKERERLDKTVRDDYAPFVAFASQSALRFESCVTLRWNEVKWETGTIVKPGKRKPGGKEKIETVPITAALHKILESQHGNHPEFVFTFVAQRTRDGRTRGRRYPLSYNGAETAFRRTLRKAKIENFGFHGLRRDRATKVWRATGNLVAVNRLLNHSNIETTMRYLGVDVSDVARAMEAADLVDGVPSVTPLNDDSKVA
jgi:integrase